MSDDVTPVEVASNRARNWQLLLLDGSNKLNPAGEACMKHLRQFCRDRKRGLPISATSGMVDPLVMAYENGRRSVLDMIQEALDYRPPNTDELPKVAKT